MFGARSVRLGFKSVSILHISPTESPNYCAWTFFGHDYSIAEEKVWRASGWHENTFEIQLLWQNVRKGRIGSCCCWQGSSSKREKVQSHRDHGICLDPSPFSYSSQWDLIEMHEIRSVYVLYSKKKPTNTDSVA
jgi:hypothetical protein